EKLECNLLVELDMTGRHNDAHPTRAENLVDAVFARDHVALANARRMWICAESHASTPFGRSRRSMVVPNRRPRISTASTVSVKTQVDAIIRIERPKFIRAQPPMA